MDSQAASHRVLDASPGGDGDDGPVAPDDGRACLTGADDSFGFHANESWTLSGQLPPGANLGGVTILRLLAEGGMGRVYEARQDAPLRTVAVKVIREGRVSFAAADRFLREAQTLADLRHPHIAQIHTCGTAPAVYGAVPFFVMELVAEARTITRFAALRGLVVRDRVKLFLKACEAVAHAHRHGVVHRDLKPANILVDAAGGPKLIDFGIARGVVEQRVDGAGMPGEPSASEVAHSVERSDVLGTLRYMSPEQVLTPERGVDARSDVYALGLVLHELLTGRLPYDLAGKTLTEAVRMLGGAAAPGTGLVERAVCGDERRDDARAIAVIVAKCLEPASVERYADAGELAADLERWLDGRAIEARPPTALESLRRFARRHRVAVVSALGLALTLVLTVAAVSLLSIRLAAQRRVAEAARGEAAAEAAVARKQLYASTLLLAAGARDRDNVADASRLLDEAGALVEAPERSRPIELACLGASLDDSVGCVSQSTETVTAVAWSPDGRAFATGDRAGHVRVGVIDRVAEPAAKTLCSIDGEVWSLAFSPDGLRLAVAGGDGVVRVVDQGSGRVIASLATGRHAVYAVAFAGNGERIVTASRDRTARLWELSAARQVAEFAGHEGTVYAVAVAPDDSGVVTGSQDGSVRIWDAGTGRVVHTLHGHVDRVFDVAIAPDGSTIASASEDGTVRLWDFAGGEEKICVRHPARVNAVTFIDEGRRVATACADGVVRTWDVEHGRECTRLRGHVGAVWSVAWSDTGERLITGGADGTARVWEPAGRRDVIDAGSRVMAAAFSPDGGSIAVGVEAAGVLLCDASTLAERGRLGPVLGRVNGVAWAPDGAVLAAACDDGAVFVWDPTTHRRVAAVAAHAKRVYSVAFSRDGTRMATASEDRTVGIHEARTGSRVAEPFVHPRRVFCAAFAWGDTRVVTACEDRVVRVWNPQTNTEERRYEGHRGPVNWVAVAPDGVRLASASSDGTVRLWAADGTVDHVLTGPTGQVWKVAYSPDGSRLAAVSADGSVHLWDTATGRSVLTLQGHRDQVWAVSFAPDGRSLLTGSWDGTARLWGVSIAEIARRSAEAGR